MDESDLVTTDAPADRMLRGRGVAGARLMSVGALLFVAFASMGTVAFGLASADTRSGSVDAEPGGTDADYARAAAMPRRVEGLVARERVEVHWLDAHRLWYDVHLGRAAPGEPQRREFKLVEVEHGTTSPLFDHAALASMLTKELGRTVAADALPVERLTLEGSTVVLLVEGGRVYRFEREGPEAGSLRAGTEADRTAFVVELSKELQRSRRRAGRSITLRFENPSQTAVTLAWIDAGGARRDYGVVAPGASREQQTFAGHAWALFAEDGTLIGSLVAPDRSSIVRAPAAAPAPPPDGQERRSSPRSPASPLWPASPRSSAATDAPFGPLSAAVASGVSASAPDGLSARVNGFNVEVVDASGAIVVATSDGTETSRYGEPFLWSPDRKRLLAMRRTPAQSHIVHIVESSPRDTLQPKLRSFDYLKPGDRIEQAWPVLLDIEGRRIVPTPDEAALYPNPWSIDRFAWSADSSAVSFLYNQRGHRVVRVISLDASTGRARAIVNEECATFFDYAGKLHFQRLERRGEILWMSERDGWNHLYLVDATTGEVKRQLTSGPWAVRSVDRVDEERGEVWFRAGGIHPEQDPYHVHHARVSLDPSPVPGGRADGIVLLTHGDGTHELEWSPDRTVYVDRWSRVDLPTVTELRRAIDGSLITVLERGDWTALLETGWVPPQRFVAKGRDGTTDIWGVLWRPSVNPTARRPVIENIYAGPQDSFVPKSFSTWHGQRDLTELGFIVVQIDGMGTSNRSKAFHDVCWKNLKDAGYPDRVAWLRAAAAAHPELDLRRVGIYGGSAGGQNAMRALLDHGDVYSVAVADCGCHDNRMDKIWWNELWMGWPVDESYVASSNAADAHRLRGKLLLTVGELDQNVDPASTMQVVDALVRADKDFDLLVLPGMGHGAGESEYGRRRRADYFVRHLLGVEPRRSSTRTTTLGHELTTPAAAGG